jgi:hypothetical protein
MMRGGLEVARSLAGNTRAVLQLDTEHIARAFVMRDMLNLAGQEKLAERRGSHSRASSRRRANTCESTEKETQSGDSVLLMSVRCWSQAGRA